MAHGVQYHMGHAHLQILNRVVVKQEGKLSQYCEHILLAVLHI